MTEKEFAEQMERTAWLNHLAEQSGWQPIATAPLDGTEVLTCHCGPNYANSIRVCWYVKDQYEGEYWQDDADSEPEPTHWMPILDPPTT